MHVDARRDEDLQFFTVNFQVPFVLCWTRSTDRRVGNSIWKLFQGRQLAEPPFAAGERAKLTDTSSPIGQMAASSDSESITTRTLPAPPSARSPTASVRRPICVPIDTEMAAICTPGKPGAVTTAG